MKKLLLIFTSIIIFSSLGHQAKGGYKDPRRPRARSSFYAE
ncbi:hypothetical protein [Neobacillus cucumis]|nr:hypothetical protein [Neobacillus cucumis]MDR4949657.1 hypothetical protein [Neobacillus cucumis]